MKLPFGKYFLKPFFAAVVMGGVALFCHAILEGFVGNSIATVLSIGFAAVVYVVLIGIFRVFSREELSSLPIIGKKFKK